MSGKLKPTRNREVFLKMSPVVTLSSMNELLNEACGGSSICVMNALMSKEDAAKRCDRYPNNGDGSKCRKCIEQWLKE